MVLRWFVIRNVHESYRPFFYLQKMTGLGPFTLSPHPSIGKRTERYGCLGYTASFMLLYSYAMYSYLWTANTGHLYLSKIVTIMENSYMASEFVATIVAIAVAFVVRHRVRRILWQLSEIDEQLCTLKHPIDHVRQHLLLTVSCGCLLVSVLVLLSATIGIVTSRVEMYVLDTVDLLAMAISSFCSLLQIIQFAVMGMFILSRYYAVNKTFR
uniref:Gustatory receptor n=1 Tax=Anopheles farauti TaxID=69004 RepID=A0A182QN62_9DIPT